MDKFSSIVMILLAFIVNLNLFKKEAYVVKGIYAFVNSSLEDLSTCF